MNFSSDLEEFSNIFDTFKVTGLVDCHISLQDYGHFDDNVMTTELLSFADLFEQVPNQQQLSANKHSDNDDEGYFGQDDPLSKLG